MPCIPLRTQTRPFVRERLVSIVTGEMKAGFWIERIGRQYQLYVSTQSLPDRKQRRRMKKMIASKICEKPAGFLAKLRSAFEGAMVSDN